MRNVILSAFLSITCASALAGCVGVAAASDSSEEAAQTAVSPDKTTPAPVYVDVEETLAEMSDSTQWLAWRGIYSTLQSNFDDVCGDTFCGGDYSNLEPLRLRCSMDSVKQTLKVCTYVFAGSYETITPSTGSIKVNAKTFSCHFPVAGVKLSDFMTTLTASGATPALRRTIPGQSSSIYDNLVGCI